MSQSLESLERSTVALCDRVPCAQSLPTCSRALWDMTLVIARRDLLFNGREELQLLYGRRIDGDLSPTKWNVGLHVQLPRRLRMASVNASSEMYSSRDCGKCGRDNIMVSWTAGQADVCGHHRTGARH